MCVKCRDPGGVRAIAEVLLTADSWVLTFVPIVVLGVGFTMVPKMMVECATGSFAC